MLTRCRNEKSTGWKRYGGRGIRVCDAWEKFEAFFSDMGTCPPEHEIDRIDNDGNYEPGNCRWVLPPIQARNRRSTRWIAAFGERLPIVDWASRTGVPGSVIGWRLKRGWTPETAVATPITRQRA
jgi:hypothetical protein